LVNYHYHLRKIVIYDDPKPNSSKLSASKRSKLRATRSRILADLLSKQQEVIEVLSLRETSEVATVMGHRRSDGSPWNIRELDLTDSMESEKGFTTLIDAIEEGVLARVESPVLRESRLTGAGFAVLIEAFLKAGEEGVAPSLRKLDLCRRKKDDSDHEDPVGDVLSGLFDDESEEGGEDNYDRVIDDALMELRPYLSRLESLTIFVLPLIV